MSNYKIYIHGRPQGQDIWPQCDNSLDKQYIEPFLDSRLGNDVNALMQIDIWQGNAYYSYIQRKNYVERIARGEAGSSYFAITLRVDNAICKNVNTLFSLFQRVFEQLCFGKIIKETNGIKQFVISQFRDNVDDIISIIAKNVDQIIAPTFFSIESGYDTINTSPVRYALQDVDSPAFFVDMTKRKVIVSPDFMSKEEENASLLKQISPIKKQCDDLKSELSRKEHDTNELKAINNSQRQNISLLEKEKSSLENKITTATADVKKELKAKNEELIRIKNLYQKQEEQLRNLQSKINEHEDNIDEIDFVKQIREPLNMYARQKASRFPSGRMADSNNRKSQSISFEKLLPWINCLLLLCIFIFSLLFMFSFYSNKDNLVKQNANEAKNELITTNNTINEDTVSISSALESLEPTHQLEFTIDINGYSGKGPLQVGKTYTLKAKNCNENVSWSVQGSGKVNGNLLTVTGSGNITISGMVNNGRIKSRSFSTIVPTTDNQKNKKKQKEEKKDSINNKKTK